MKKIMFNDQYGLTQAVLDGRKTMTRRIVPKHILNKVEEYQDEYYNGTLEIISDEDAILALCTYEHSFKPPYQVGEVVAIAQSYQTIFNEESLYRENKLIDIIKSMAVAKGRAGWNNKMFVRAKEMPHHIRITDIRVERLQDISNKDCLREGIIDNNDIVQYQVLNNCFFSPREAFAYLINKVSGKGTWESNHYVFVYEFKLVD